MKDRHNESRKNQSSGSWGRQKEKKKQKHLNVRGSQAVPSNVTKKKHHKTGKEKFLVVNRKENESNEPQRTTIREAVLKGRGGEQMSRGIKRFSYKTGAIRIRGAMWSSYKSKGWVKSYQRKKEPCW